MSNLREGERGQKRERQRGGGDLRNRDDPGKEEEQGIGNECQRLPER